MSVIQRLWRRLIESSRENQWFLPILGAVIGVILAFAFGLSEASPDEVAWTLTVAEGRSTLLSWLSILFAAFSIILALATLTIQNVVSKYSVRMYRLYQRDLRDRYVLALFAMTAAYIITEQILLRTVDPGAPVPATGFAIALVLLIATGIALIWYITTITRWFRVDQVVRRIGLRSLAGAEVGDAIRKGTSTALPADFERPSDAVPILARRSGFLVEPDPRDVADDMAGIGGTALIDVLEGLPVVRGQEIGWLTAPDAAGELDAAAERIAANVEIESERGVAGSIEFAIVVQVDTAIMALSPAINDPNTAVQIVEELTFMFVDLAGHDLGSHMVRREVPVTTVVVRSRSFGDYLRLGTEQILLYGQGDPLVVQSLRRMVGSLASVDLAAADRAAVDELALRLDSLDLQ